MTTYFPIYQKNIKKKKFFFFLSRNYTLISIILFMILSLGLILIDSKKESLSPVKHKLNEFFYSIAFIDDLSKSFKIFYNSIFIHNNTIDEQGYKEIVESVKRLYKAENQQLMNLLNFIDEYDIDKSKIITTTAIIDVKNHSIILRSNKKDNIKPDQLIINEVGLVGKITEVYENFSKGILITNKKFKIPVVSAETEHSFILNGQNGKCLKQLYLTESLNNMEILLLSSGLHARGIHVARNEENCIRSLVDPERINFVSILN